MQEQTSKLVFHAQSTIRVISGPYSKQINYIYIRAQEPCGEGGGTGSHSLSRSSPVPNKPYGFRFVKLVL